MSDPSVEEIVAWIERRLNDGMSSVYLPAHLCRALIADWRKRGEALLPFASAVDGYGRHKGAKFSVAYLPDLIKARDVLKGAAK